MKSDKIIDWINFGIYPGYCMLSVGFTFDEIIAHLKESEGNDKDLKDWILGIEGSKTLIDSIAKSIYFKLFFHCFSLYDYF